MSELKLDQGEWVVVCDGAKALILENTGTRAHPSLKTREVLQQPDAKTSEIGTDQPGRAFASVGASRSAVEQTDFHAQAEQRFLADLAGRLDKALTEGRAKSLTVVAPPRALGLLRQAYSSHVKQALHAEISKDFVKMPVPEIEKHLTGH
jgi:protein required for attachment to host cells